MAPARTGCASASTPARWTWRRAKARKPHARFGGVKRFLLVAGAALLVLVPNAYAADRQSPHAKCDRFDPAVCLQPFPNNLFTKPSAKTDTGLRVAFNLTSMPRNVAGKPIQPGQ